MLSTQCQWHFHRTARAFVAAQTQYSSNDCNSPSSSSSNNDDDYLTELNHWVIEHRDGVKNGSQDEENEVVYLLHPPVLIPYIDRELNTKVSLVSHGDCEIEEVAEEYNIEIMDEINDEQPSVLSVSTICNEYTEWTFSIVFHETWRVPTLYFTCGHSDGTPLSRRQVLHILLSHVSSCQSMNDHNTNNGGVMEVDWNEEELWEFVSQEEHPVTGKPAYFLHPCRTSERMEMMLSMQSNEENDGSRCPLLSWMSMVLPVVGCKISSEIFCRIQKSIAQKEH